MKRRNPIHAYKHLLAKDYDWDYAYLIALEKKKLQRMHDCIKRENHLMNNEFVVREIAICIRLIDIFMENDSVYNTWLDRSFSGDCAFGNWIMDCMSWMILKNALLLFFSCLCEYEKRATLFPSYTHQRCTGTR